MTTQNNYALNSFQVLEQSGEPINESCRALHICSALRQNLIEGEVKGHINIHRQSKSRQAQHFPIATNIKFIADPLNRYTLIELITTDHAGLLAKIGSAFIKQQVNLLNAKITTIGSRAEDMFYITDQHLQAITDPEQQAQIREEILTSLAED